MDLNAVKNEMLTEARNAANKFFQEKLGGEDRYACGFAWVTVYPEYKGNTKQGKMHKSIVDAFVESSYSGPYANGYTRYMASYKQVEETV